LEQYSHFFTVFVGLKKSLLQQFNQLNHELKTYCFFAAVCLGKLVGSSSQAVTGPSFLVFIVLPFSIDLVVISFNISLSLSSPCQELSESESRTEGYFLMLSSDSLSKLILRNKYMQTLKN